MMNVCYIDCFSGIAGDMLLSALIDAGASIDKIKQQLNTIEGIRNEWDISVTNVLKSKGLISAKYLKVDSVYNHKPIQLSVHNANYHYHDHDTDNSHDNSDLSNQQTLDHSHTHSHDSNTIETNNLIQNHSHNHSHNNNEHNHVHSSESSNHDHSHVRGLREITELINNSSLSNKVKYQSLQAFNELAKAEAKVHGTTIDNVHFHEVGAIDSIIDTVGVFVALELLNIDDIYCSALPLSSGTVWTAHGLLPVPSPATLYLMKDMKVIPGPKGITGELVTPTGATLVRVMCKFPPLELDDNIDSSKYSSNKQGVSPINGLVLRYVGVGAGTKDFSNIPNILRVLIGTIPNISANTVNNINHLLINNLNDYDINKLLLLETNLDDITGELCGYILDQLISSGVNDSWIENIHMKKNRPAIKLCVLCDNNNVNNAISIIFKESTGIGIRISYIDRIALKRDVVSLSTTYGNINVKISYLNNKIVSMKPEYEDCKAIATSLNIPLKSVISVVNICIESYKQENNNNN